MTWYPYTQMKNFSPSLKVNDAGGVFLYTNKGKLIDSISSWWAVSFGYKNPYITNAIITQAQKFSHVMLAGLSHDPVEKLSKKLEEFLPGDLNYSFYSDSGSVAVEVALKMALQFCVNRGEKKRTKVLSLTNGYHGDTIKTMEIGDDEDYHSAYKKYFNKKNVIHVKPNVEDIKKALKKHHSSLNAFIVEPLLQGAGGMRLYDIEVLKTARKLCDEFGVLLIFDEVATGLGKTGNRFVADLVCPDILVLGKALTGGYIGHAVTVANKKVFDGFYGDSSEIAFMHGPTFMANPLACSAALAAIELFEKENYLDKIKKIEEFLKKSFEGFSCPKIKEIRILGVMVCIEVYDKKELAGYQEYAIARGVFARPFLNYLYAMLPFVIEQRELEVVVNCMKEWFFR